MKYSIVWLSEAVAAGFRIDAEYWQPEFIRNSALVSSAEKIRDFVTADVANIKSSPIGRDFEYLEISGIAASSCEYRTSFVAKGEAPNRAHYILEPGDVVVSTVRPNRNAVALVMDEGLVGSSGLAVLRSDELEPAYLLAFCKTDYFIKCLVRANKATMYPAVSVRDVLDTPIFTGSREFRALVSGCVVNALESQYDANDAYSDAETILLAELQFDEWQPRRQNWSVRYYSEAVAAGRIDAEYFHPKYDGLLDVIKSYAGGWDTLSNLANTRTRNSVPDKDTLYKYIELANISQNGQIVDCTVEYGSELPTRARRKVTTGDVIVSSIEGSLDSVAMIDDEYDGALCSTGFHVVNSQVLNPETLLMLLKSPIGQMQLKRGCSGTILTAINSDEFGRIALPVVSDDLQDAIRRRVREATALRQQSRRLLGTAVGAVQRAIEQGEAAAIAWLEMVQSTP